MALSLGVSIGDRIAVGKSIVEVRAIHGLKHMVLSVDNGPDITVNDSKAHPVKILPNVRAFVGLGKHASNNRLAFEAPKTIPIELLGKASGISASKADIHKAQNASSAPPPKALFLNGVYEQTITDILNSQKEHVSVD